MNVRPCFENYTKNKIRRKTLDKHLENTLFWKKKQFSSINTNYIFPIDASFRYKSCFHILASNIFRTDQKMFVGPEDVKGWTPTKGLMYVSQDRQTRKNITEATVCRTLGGFVPWDDSAREWRRFVF